MQFYRDNNQDLTVMFISTRGRLRSFEPRFSIVLIDNTLDHTGSFSEVPVITSVSYFDIDGNPASGPLTSSYQVEMR